MDATVADVLSNGVPVVVKEHPDVEMVNAVPKALKAKQKSQ